MVLVVIVAAGVFVFLGNVNDIVRAAVEKVGSDMTQTNVTLNEVDIEITSGKGALRGSSDDDAFKFDEVSVTIDVTTVRSGPVVIKEIVIQGPAVAYEFGDNDVSNLDQLNKNVQSKVGGGDKSAKKSGDSPNIVIENLYLRGGSVSVVAPLLNEKLGVPLPTIHLKDIGKDGKGATPEEIADQVMQAILKGAQDAVTNAKIDVSKLTGVAMEQVGKAAEDAKKALESVTSGGGDVGKALESVTSGGGSDIGKDAGSAIKGLLGK